ncbi:TetR/AcrR family transcriptional regulator [Tistrella bauzanensis]|uniref:TetR/AcrR family transcriptional regulator n=1 Tax=Tistrella arctica TaxID=3133430 RepID=A0ABU9YEH4_9PROT
MARQRDEEKRLAILSAAARVIADEGLSAPTAKIARAAGVADGTLFVYFSNKDVLLNDLYLHLKEELKARVAASVSHEADLRTQLNGIWKTWTDWGVHEPAKRRALAQLQVSDKITADSRAKGLDGVADMLALVRRVSGQGPMRDAPVMFIGAVMEAMATTTIDFMSGEPERAAAFCDWGFEAMWGALAAKTPVT